MVKIIMFFSFILVMGMLMMALGLG